MWPYTQLQKPLDTQRNATQPGLPFTENSRSTYVSFENLYGTNLTCRICDDKNSLENEDHILTCKLLNEETHNIQFTDVYGTIEQQYKAVQMFKKILRKRTFLLIARN